MTADPVDVVVEVIVDDMVAVEVVGGDVQAVTSEAIGIGSGSPAGRSEVTPPGPWEAGRRLASGSAKRKT